MTIEPLRKAHLAQPFRPFVLRTAEGRAFRVPHPEFLSHSSTGRTVIVHHGREDYSIFDLLLITEIEVCSRRQTRRHNGSRPRRE